jgi:hypothetical protein
MRGHEARWPRQQATRPIRSEDRPSGRNRGGTCGRDGLGRELLASANWRGTPQPDELAGESPAADSRETQGLPEVYLVTWLPDQAAYGVRHADRDPAQGELAKARAQQ